MISQPVSLLKVIVPFGQIILFQVFKLFFKFSILNFLYYFVFFKLIMKNLSYRKVWKSSIMSIYSLSGISNYQHFDLFAHFIYPSEYFSELRIEGILLVKKGFLHLGINYRSLLKQQSTGLIFSLITTHDRVRNWGNSHLQWYVDDFIWTSVRTRSPKHM